MSTKMNWIVCLMAALMLGSLVPYASADEATDAATDKAFEDLKSYDWGQDRNILKPIDDAVVAAHKDAAAKKALQTKLVAVVAGDGSRAAKDFACRKLSLIADAGAVPTLATLLTDEKLSHMARYALERMPCPEAVAAMRGAMAKTKGKTKIGVINSLGIRRDAESTKALTALLGDSDQELVAAAAAALGNIATVDAAAALGAFQAKAPQKLALVAADACLTCAERLLADGEKAQAKAIYMTLAKSTIKHVRVAAMRGMLATAGAK